jgi:hypothetical protein
MRAGRRWSGVVALPPAGGGWTFNGRLRDQKLHAAIDSIGEETCTIIAAIRPPTPTRPARKAGWCLQDVRSALYLLCDPTLIKLVRTPAGVVDLVQGFAEVVGDGVGGGDEVLVGLDLDGAVTAGGADRTCGWTSRWCALSNG